MKASMFSRNLAVLVLLPLLWSCSTTIDDYSDTEPAFSLKEYFTGNLQAWGYVRDYKGKVIQRFSVDMKGSWQGNQGELYELFTYSDGTTQERIWKLEVLEDGTSKGTANDVIGTAHGKENGFAFNWTYTLEIETDDGKMNVKLNDWLYQIDNRVVASQSDIKKFGAKVGEVVLFMIKSQE